MSDQRERVQETHKELFEFVQRQFNDLMTAVQEAELDLVRRCQGIHEGIVGHCNQRHQGLAGKGDPDFIRTLDRQGEELVRIAQTRFAEMTRDLKQCHGGACQVLNGRVADFALERGRTAAEDAR